MAKKYLTIEEAADMIRLSYDCVRKKIKRGEMKASKIGKNILIEESEVHLFVKRHQVIAS